MTQDGEPGGALTRSWRINSKYQSGWLTVTDDTITIDHKHGKPSTSWPRSELLRAYVSKLAGTIPRRDGIVLEFEFDPRPILDANAVVYTRSYWVPTLWGFWSSSEGAHTIADFLNSGR